MNVLLDINGLVNRGDQLMLATCYEQTRARLPRATICVGENVYREGIAWCRARGVLPLAPRRPGANARFKEYAVRIFQAASHRRFRLYPSQIDLVLAAPGFHYGDAFANIYSDRMVEREIRKFRSFKKKKRRIVLLPQALGPFEKPLSHRLFEGVLACTDIVYARDKTSFDLVLKWFPEAKTRLRLGPDFTCLAEGTNPTVSFPHRSTVVIIPNVRMTTHAGESGESYVAFMVNVCKMLTERGARSGFAPSTLADPGWISTTFVLTISTVMRSAGCSFAMITSLWNRQIHFWGNYAMYHLSTVAVVA